MSHPVILLRSALGVASLSFLVVTGCGGGNGSKVDGDVTFNGKAIEKGYINFYPADGKGAPAGGEIVKGHFSVRNVTPGKNRVDVTESSPTQAPDTMDAGIAAAKKAAPPSKDTLTAGCEGNGQVHDIASGSATLNLTLKTAMTSDGKVK